MRLTFPIEILKYRQYLLNLLKMTHCSKNSHPSSPPLVYMQIHANMHAAGNIFFPPPSIVANLGLYGVAHVLQPAQYTARPLYPLPLHCLTFTLRGWGPKCSRLTLTLFTHSHTLPLRWMVAKCDKVTGTIVKVGRNESKFSTRKFRNPICLRVSSYILHCIVTVLQCCSLSLSIQKQVVDCFKVQACPFMCTEIKTY